MCCHLVDVKCLPLPATPSVLLLVSTACRVVAGLYWCFPGSFSRLPSVQEPGTFWLFLSLQRDLQNSVCPPFPHAPVSQPMFLQGWCSEERRLLPGCTPGDAGKAARARGALAWGSLVTLWLVTCFCPKKTQSEVRRALDATLQPALLKAWKHSPRQAKGPGKETL